LIHLRDESSASLGFRSLVSLGFSKTDANDVSFKGLFYPPNIMQCVNVLQACCTKVFQGALQIQLCSNMKQEMAIHRYKIQNTRFTREAFIVIKREFTRYKNER
jgi:hypothetical protein